MDYLLGPPIFIGFMIIMIIGIMTIMLVGHCLWIFVAWLFGFKYPL